MVRWFNNYCSSENIFAGLKYGCEGDVQYVRGMNISHAMSYTWHVVVSSSEGGWCAITRLVQHASRGE